MASTIYPNDSDANFRNGRGQSGPWVDANKNVYAALRHPTTNFGLHMMKSTEPLSVAWAVQNSGSNPKYASTTFSDFAGVQDGRAHRL